MVPESSVPARGPVRTCVGCRQRATQEELLRVVARAGASDQDTWHVVPDPRHRAPGRGAHLHPTDACLARAERSRAFVRALRHDVAGLGALDLEPLRQHLAQQNPQHDTRTTTPTETGSTSS